MNTNPFHDPNVLDLGLRASGYRRSGRRDAMNDKQLLALGKKMHENPSAITSNMEAYAFRSYVDQLKREAIERDGCCGGTPGADGVCFGIGLCPRVSFDNQGAK